MNNKDSENRDVKIKWLWRYRNAMFMAESLWRQAEEWQDVICEPSCKVLDGMPKSPSMNGDTTRDIVKHLELKEEAIEATVKAKNIRKEITGAINNLNDDLHIKILTLRYLEGLKWPEIRNIIGYSPNYTTNLHYAALTNLNISGDSGK